MLLEKLIFSEFHVEWFFLSWKIGLIDILVAQKIIYLFTLVRITVLLLLLIFLAN